MRRTWEHDHDTREIERVSGRSTRSWFDELDRAGAREKGMVSTIHWLTGAKRLPHHLVATLAWNYFNPSTLPRDIAPRIGEKHHTVELHLLHRASAHRQPLAKLRAAARPHRRSRTSPVASGARKATSASATRSRRRERRGRRSSGE